MIAPLLPVRDPAVSSGVHSPAGTADSEAISDDGDAGMRRAQ
ncbi:hypothetical protein [Dactylosporangium fulvum]|uniref:Uncharacterized protein n=1 Tax=Dactylosporangium fulvum TaxID=53359 RepID=A0ABY5W983_9ACTN|nr:hypothetical protein [Dactylosporangium fulvum]UWP86432.1 hypothetical protein Dfulv_20185 [Dactylosporangium fulvum]